MNKLLLIFLIFSPIYLLSQGGPDCSSMEPICTDVGLNFTANSGVAEASTTDPGNDYNCLITQPNPSWYFIEVATSGDIDMQLSAASDIDFVIWGPFNSLSIAQANCGILGNPPANNVVDCSFSATNTETPSIAGAIIGEVYVMLITNYADVVQDVTLQQVGGTGSTNCNIVTNPPCAMTAFNVNVSGCNFTTSSYDVTGSIFYDDPPSSGDLVVEDCNGNLVVVDSYPFAASPQNFSLLGLTADGMACDVEAYFTADLTCTQIYNYVAPVCIVNCPSYDLNASSPTQACGNQTYYLEIQNSGCDGYIEFEVVGNYGSADANEITWQVSSNTTTNIVASGGPGTNGGSINVTVGPLNPAVEGYIYRLEIFDSFGDGFNGVGGTISIQQGGSDIITPITGNFGSSQSLLFQAGLVVSSSTLTVNTPSGVVTSTMGNCQDHEVGFTLSNTNFCTPIQVSLPWQIVCDNSGSLIASGSHTVVVYPQVPTDATDVVSVTWNSSTCQWDVSPNNDCSSLDIGSLFTISPNPSGISNYCANGNENFTVDYLGFASGPNCCSTAGPSVPITYTNSTVVTDAAVQNSPFGGVNNSAYINIPANMTGGNATSFTLDVDLTGFCVDPPGIGGSQNFWVTVYVDGWIIYDQQQIAPASSFSNSFNLANLPYGYNENSIIEVYVYPNSLGSTWDRNDPCPVNDGEWNLSTLNTTLNVTFDQSTSTPVSCALPITPAYTCCIVNPITADPPADATVSCLVDVPAINTTSVTNVVSDCPTTITHVSDVSDGNTCPEVITRTYRVTDDCGNSIDVSQIITIHDLIVPVLAAGPIDVTVECIGDVPAMPNLGWTDNCDGAGSVAGSDGALVGGSRGVTITRTWPYTDACGNPATATQTITVDDATPPTASNPAPVSVQCITDVPMANPAVVTDEVDNCGIPTVTFDSDISDGGSCPEIITRIYTVTDACGNSINVFQTITIQDDIAPTASNPITITVQCPSDIPMPDISIINNASDNCTTNPFVEYMQDISDGLSCPETIIRTYHIIDDCGNIGIVTQTIIVHDNTPPVASTPAITTIENNQTIPAPDISIIMDASDNCSSPIVTYVGETSDGNKCPETITRTYSVMDECGNEILISHVLLINSNCEIVIPSAFTPNGDFANDVWEIVNLDLIFPKNKVYVYNRWGNIIFESKQGDYGTNRWDGKVNGELLPVGSYYYMIYPNGDKSEDVIKGTVSIVFN